MEITHIIAFNFVLLAAMASPGPSMLFLIKTTLAKGQRAGIAAASGLALMAALWTLAALLGAHGIFQIFPILYATLKIAGASYLIWMALSAWKSAGKSVTAAEHSPTNSLFISGFLVNIGNPKSVLFAAAVITAIFPPEMSGFDKALIFANHLLVEMTLLPLLAVLLSIGTVNRAYQSLKYHIDKITAVALGFVGIRLLVQ